MMQAFKDSGIWVSFSTMALWAFNQMPQIAACLAAAYTIWKFYIEWKKERGRK